MASCGWLGWSRKNTLPRSCFSYLIIKEYPAQEIPENLPILSKKQKLSQEFSKTEYSRRKGTAAVLYAARIYASANLSRNMDILPEDEIVTLSTSVS